MKAVVFDLDGTLVNTIPDITSTVNSVLHSHGFAEKSMSEVEAGVGFGVEHLLQTLGVPGKMNSRMVNEINRVYSEMKHSKSYLYSGIESLIKRVSKAGIMMFILSNKLQRSLEKSVSDHLCFAEFLSITGSQPGFPAKPSPVLLLGMLDRFNVPLDSALMVGDGEADIAVARAAGIPCVSVLWGFRSREALEVAGADLFAETPEDAAELILGEE